MDNILAEDTVERVNKADEKYFSFQQNDEQYFSYLYDQFSSALLGIICQRINNKTKVEVILAAVFINAWKNRNFFNEKNERIFTWLYKITTNECDINLRKEDNVY